MLLPFFIKQKKMKPIEKSYLIEINVGTTNPGNGVNINFQDFPQLRDIYLTGIQVFDLSTVLTSPSGKTVVGALTGATVTLLDIFNQEIIRSYPAQDLSPFYNSGIYRDFKPFKLQLTKSYITILDNTTTAANESYIVNIFYISAKDFKNVR
jgi:hypothetical protein